MTQHTLYLLSSDIDVGIAHVEKMGAYIADQAIGLAGKPGWMKPHIAAGIPIQNGVTMQQMKEMREIVSEDRIDLLCIPHPAPERKLLICDMDATIVESETLDELAAKAGIKDRIAAITARAMNGELDFKAALKERVALLEGLPVSALYQTLEETKLCKGADTLVMSARAKGMTCVLVSGGFTFFTNAIGEKCGFNVNHGNSLGNDGKVLDGTVGEPILDKDSKLAFLKSHAQELGIDLAQTVALGDGANDIPMLAAAGLGIGYRPKPVVEENIMNCLKYADLDRLLYVI